MYRIFRSKIFFKQYIALLGISLIIFLGIGISVYWITKNTMEEQAIFSVEQYRNQLLQDITGRIDNIDESIRIQAKYIENIDPEVYGSDLTHRLLLEILDDNSRIIDLLLIDGEGRILNSRGGPSSINLIERSYVRNGLMGEATITEPYKALKDDAIIMTISYPIWIEDQPQYVLAGVISLKNIKNLIENVSYNLNGKAFLVDKNGDLITNVETTNNETPSIKFNNLGIEEVIKGNNGVKKYIDHMGSKVVGSYSWIEGLNTGLVVEIDEDYIMKPLYDLYTHFKIIVLVAFIIILFLALFIANRTYKPIHQLIEAAQRLKESSTPQRIEIKTHDELDILIQKFNEMQFAIQKREEEIQKLASRDALTGTLNRRGGMEKLKEEIHESIKNDHSLSIMFADINDLKDVNDHFGHNEGDKLIKLAAEFVHSNIEPNHSIARFGGDEFLVILPKCTQEHALAIKNKIQNKIIEFNEEENEKFNISISFGVAQYDKVTQPSTDKFIEIADSRMYKAKGKHKRIG